MTKVVASHSNKTKSPSSCACIIPAWISMKTLRNVGVTKSMVMKFSHSLSYDEQISPKFPNSLLKAERVCWRLKPCKFSPWPRMVMKFTINQIELSGTRWCHLSTPPLAVSSKPLKKSATLRWFSIPVSNKFIWIPRTVDRIDLVKAEDPTDLPFAISNKFFLLFLSKASHAIVSALS